MPSPNPSPPLTTRTVNGGIVGAGGVSPRPFVPGSLEISLTAVLLMVILGTATRHGVVARTPLCRPRHFGPPGPPKQDDVEAGEEGMSS